jgi:hypothetical protein
MLDIEIASIFKMGLGWEKDRYFEQKFKLTEFQLHQLFFQIGNDCN